MAAEESTNRQDRPHERAGHPEGVHGVLRTTRVTAASRPQRRGDEPLVEPEQGEEGERERSQEERRCARNRLGHREPPAIRSRAARRKARKSVTSASTADARATSTRSTAGRPAISCRIASRSLRFTRLRTTAPPTLDETVMPTRAGLPPGCADAAPSRDRQVAASGPSTKPGPPRTARNSPRRRKRDDRGKEKDSGASATALLLRGAHDEALAALRTTPLEDVAPLLGAHPLAEPVLPVAPDLARLVGALHRGYSDTGGDFAPEVQREKRGT